MVAVTFPLSTAPGNRAQESGGRLINCYAEPTQDSSGRAAIYRRNAGLKAFATSNQSGFRGAITLPGTVYAAFEDQLLTGSSAGGALTVHGSLAGSDKTIFARNQNSVPDVVAITENGASAVTSGGVIDYPDADIGQPNSAAWISGYFIFTYGNGKIQASGLNSTSINTLDFVTAESNPDGLLRGIAFNNMFLAFGPNSCEFYSTTSINETGFPLNRSTATPHGLGARFAIAGHEDGYGKALLWVTSGNRVTMLKGGFDPVEVSTSDLDRLIAKVTDKDTLEACIHIENGIPWWTLSCPDWSWSLNLNTLKWSERASWLMPRWRGTQTCYVNGKWIIGDTDSGDLFEIDPSTSNEGTNPLRYELESALVRKFPDRIPVMRADLDVTVGIGSVLGATVNETHPKIEISMSRDGGVNWDAPRVLELGEQSNSDLRVYATRFGTAGPYGPRFRIAYSDTPDVGFCGLEISAAVRK